MWAGPRDCYWDTTLFTLKSLALTLFFSQRIKGVFLWVSLCFTSRPAKMWFSALNQIFMFFFQQTEWGQDLSLSGRPQPLGQGSGGVCCEGVSRHQQISSSPSAAIPVAICLFKVENYTKIFLIFLPPPLCLLPESYLNLEGGRRGECSLSARTVSHYFPSTTLHLFFYDCDTKTWDRRFFSARLSV